MAESSAGQECRDDAWGRSLPDAPVPLLRLDSRAVVVAANRAALEALETRMEVLRGQPCDRIWGLPLEALSEPAGIWLAPDGDPAHRVRHRQDRDNGGWWLSLPHAETAGLLRDAARLERDDVAESSLLEPVARRLHQAEGGQRLLGDISVLLSGCNLDLPPLQVSSAAHPLSRRVAAGFGNLAEAIRQALLLSTQIAGEVNRVAGENDELARQSQNQVDALETVLAASRRLLQGLVDVRADLTGVRQAAACADEDAQKGSQAAEALATAMQEVERSTRRAGDVIEVIDSVAFQTNILSINASIEAAHAGEAGRGFAIVATEIRRLAERAASAARDVRVIINGTTEALGNSSASARETGKVLNGIGLSLGRTSAAMEAVAGRIAAQDQEVIAIDQAVERTVALSRSNLEHAAVVASRSEALGQGVSTLHDCMSLFRLPADPMREPRHARVRELATSAATEIGDILSAAVAEGAIDVEALFSREYVPIPEVEPPKYTTEFDALCDGILPSVQERVLASEPWIVFAISANPDGYVPTHNLRFSKALTGDKDADLIGNRTKRIFSDRVGRSVGAHTDPYRLQVYRRDTGQIMMDLSVPILVDGRHWGGFRVGYTLE